MKTLPANFNDKLYANLNEVHFTQTIRKKRYSFFNDNGDMILMKNVINVSTNDVNLYLDVMDNRVAIYEPNKIKRCYNIVATFWAHDFKNTTSMSMAIALRIMKYYNDL